MTYFLTQPLVEPLHKIKDRHDLEEAVKSRCDVFINLGMNGMFNNDMNEGAFAQRRWRQNLCRKMWDNIFNDEDFEYLVGGVDKEILNASKGIKEVIKLQYPAKLRRIPIVRPRLEFLRSKEYERPLLYQSYAFHEAALERKKKAHIDRILEFQRQRIQERIKGHQKIQELIAERQYMLQQIQQQQAQQQQAQAQAQGQQDPTQVDPKEIMKMVMRLQQEIEQLQKYFDSHKLLDDSQLEEINNKFSRSYKDIQEILIESGIKEFVSSRNLRSLFNAGFVESLITDEEIFYADWQPGMPNIDYRITRPEDIWYQSNDGITDISQAAFSVEFVPMAYNNLVARLGHELTEKLREEIASMPSPQGSIGNWFDTNLHYYPDGRFAGNTDVTWATRYNQYTFATFLVYWKEDEPVHALIEKNTKPGLKNRPDFIRFIDDEEAESIRSNKAKMEKKGWKVETRYRQTLWSAHRIGQSHYLKWGQCEVALRDPRNPEEICLPYIGRVVNRYQVPYSRIWATKDVVEAYHSLHYQRELLIALAGTRGIVYDLAQKPNGMEMPEIIYYMKNGLMPINTVKDGRQTSTFNQFQSYDMSLSPAIQLIEEAMQRLNDLAGFIIGVNDQSLGEVSKGDFVGTTDLALQQSNLVQESLFLRHEELVEQFLTRIANLMPMAYKEGRMGSFIYGDNQEILNIPAESLEEDGIFVTYIKSGSRERNNELMARQFIVKAIEQNQIPASAFMAVMDKKTVKEMMEVLKKYEDMALKLQQSNLQQAHELQKELVTLQQQADQQLAQVNGTVMREVETLKQQTAMQRVAMEKQIKEAELQANKEQDQRKIEVDMYKSDSERLVEEKYLQFQYDNLSAQVEQEDKALQLEEKGMKLDIIGKVSRPDISKPRSKERIKD